MYKLAILFSVFFVLNATAKINNDSNCLEHELKNTIFSNLEEFNNDQLDINSIEVVEIEEEVNLNFDTKNYLPENFNALKGKDDLNWDTIELVELEEEVKFDFDTKDYLPENFNALKGKNDLDWNTIELVELEEEVEFDFDTKDYLPNNFNPSEGMHSNNVVACLY